MESKKLVLVVMILGAAPANVFVSAADPDPLRDFEGTGALGNFVLRDVFKNGVLSNGPGGVRASINTTLFPGITTNVGKQDIETRFPAIKGKLNSSHESSAIVLELACAKDLHLRLDLTNSSASSSLPDCASRSTMHSVVGRMFRGNPFNNSNAFKWIEMEVLVGNPVTGCFRAFPDLRAKGLISSSCMGISQDFKEYTVCFVKSRSCEEKKVEIRAHIHNSRLGCWRAASTPLDWCQLENMGEMVGNATLYLLCGHYKNLNDPEYVGLFTLDLEGLRFELKQTWPWDERLHRNHGLCVSCHGRTACSYGICKEKQVVMLEVKIWLKVLVKNAMLFV
ncbi:hypothetical protein SELMODRAFT_411560 [Selaginella moellendorffii]|uniref:Pherophorin domain-containing protein n=1 Tax=Selaginella moellendorffii TaxID=88036 RepID=D8RIB7_SELML|nr:hypothetical protein SELMODRAFT_411560 [Selaginella moellendorffii]